MSTVDEADLTLSRALEVLRERLPGCEVTITLHLSTSGGPHWGGDVYDPAVACPHLPSGGCIAHAYFWKHVTAASMVAELVRQSAQRVCTCTRCNEVRESAAAEAAAAVEAP